MATPTWAFAAAAWSFAEAITQYGVDFQNMPGELDGLDGEIRDTVSLVAELRQLIANNETTHYWCDEGVRRAQKCIVDCQGVLGTLRNLLQKPGSSTEANSTGRDLDVNLLGQPKWPPTYRHQLLDARAELDRVYSRIQIAQTSYLLAGASTPADKETFTEQLNKLLQREELAEMRSQRNKDAHRKKHKGHRARKTSQPSQSHSGPSPQLHGRHARDNTLPQDRHNDASQDENSADESDGAPNMSALYDDFYKDRLRIAREQIAAEEAEKAAREMALQDLRQAAIDTYQGYVRQQRMSLESKRQELRAQLDGKMPPTQINDIIGTQFPDEEEIDTRAALIPSRGSTKPTLAPTTAGNESLYNTKDASLAPKGTPQPKRPALANGPPSSWRFGNMFRRRSSKAESVINPLPSNLQQVLTPAGRAGLKGFVIGADDDEKMRPTEFDVPEDWLVKRLSQQGKGGSRKVGAQYSPWDEFALLPQSYRRIIDQVMHEQALGSATYSLLYVERKFEEQRRFSFSRKRLPELKAVFVILKSRLNAVDQGGVQPLLGREDGLMREAEAVGSPSQQDRRPSQVSRFNRNSRIVEGMGDEIDLARAEDLFDRKASGSIKAGSHRLNQSVSQDKRAAEKNDGIQQARSEAHSRPASSRKDLSIDTRSRLPWQQFPDGFSDINMNLTEDQLSPARMSGSTEIAQNNTHPSFAQQSRGQAQQKYEYKSRRPIQGMGESKRNSHIDDDSFLDSRDRGGDYGSASQRRHSKRNDGERASRKSVIKGKVPWNSESSSENESTFSAVANGRAPIGSSDLSSHRRVTSLEPTPTSQRMRVQSINSDTYSENTDRLSGKGSLVQKEGKSKWRNLGNSSSHKEREKRRQTSGSVDHDSLRPDYPSHRHETPNSGKDTVESPAENFARTKNEVENQLRDETIAQKKADGEMTSAYLSSIINPRFASDDPDSIKAERLTYMVGLPGHHDALNKAQRNDELPHNNSRDAGGQAAVEDYGSKENQNEMKNTDSENNNLAKGSKENTANHTQDATIDTPTAVDRGAQNENDGQTNPEEHGTVVNLSAPRYRPSELVEILSASLTEPPPTPDSRGTAEEERRERRDLAAREAAEAAERRIREQERIQSLEKAGHHDAAKSLSQSSPDLPQPSAVNGDDRDKHAPDTNITHDAASSPPVSLEQKSLNTSSTGGSDSAGAGAALAPTEPAQQPASNSPAAASASHGQTERKLLSTRTQGQRRKEFIRRRSAGSEDEW